MGCLPGREVVFTECVCIYRILWFNTLALLLYIFFLFVISFGVALLRDDVLVILLLLANLAERLRIVFAYVTCQHVLLFYPRSLSG